MLLTSLQSVKRVFMGDLKMTYQIEHGNEAEKLLMVITSFEYAESQPNSPDLFSRQH